jgi:histone acetyltransferase (RNA polymerase elongator complex component)
VKEAVTIQPEMVRFAPTLVLRETPLETLWKQGNYIPLPIDQAIEQCAYAYQQFFSHHIRIIRVGLAVSDFQNDGAEKIAAGPWHPALRHAVECTLAYRQITNQLSRHTGSKIGVHPKDVSIAVGEKRSHIARWQDQLNREIQIVPHEGQPRHTFSIHQKNYSLFLDHKE